MTKEQLKISYNNLQNFLKENLGKSDGDTVLQFKKYFGEYVKEYNSYEQFHDKTVKEMIPILNEVSCISDLEMKYAIGMHMFLLASLVKNDEEENQNERWN